MNDVLPAHRDDANERRRGSWRGVAFAAGIAGASSLGCQASLDLDRYAFDEAAGSPPTCTPGEPGCPSEGLPEGLPPCDDGQRAETSPCRGALKPCQGPSCPARLTGALSTVVPGTPMGPIELRDARLETVAESCGTFRGASVCVRGRISE